MAESRTRVLAVCLTVAYILTSNVVCGGPLQEWEKVRTRVNRLCYEGDYETAGRAAEKALAMAEKSFGPDRRQTAEALDMLAVVRRRSGKPGEAVPLLERALAIKRKTLGSTDRAVASTLQELGAAQKASGRYAEAERSYSESLSIREGQLGRRHALTATTMRDLADLYAEQKKYEQAVDAYTRALDLLAESFGTDSDVYERALLSLAALHREEGRPDAARALEKRLAFGDGADLKGRMIGGILFVVVMGVCTLVALFLELRRRKRG